MKLVIDFPGLDPAGVQEVARVLAAAGFDREILGMARNTNIPLPGDLTLVLIEPLEAS